jgi:hypothetical protein
MEANMAVQTQLPIMVRKSLWPTLAQNGMYLKDIAGDGMQPQTELFACVHLLIKVIRQLSLRCPRRPALYQPRQTPRSPQERDRLHA